MQLFVQINFTSTYKPHLSSGMCRITLSAGTSVSLLILDFIVRFSILVVSNL